MRSIAHHGIALEPPAMSKLLAASYRQRHHYVVLSYWLKSLRSKILKIIRSNRHFYLFFCEAIFDL